MNEFSLLLALGFLISGCSTMHFTQTVSKQQSPETVTHSKWHDTTLNGMVEISYPVNLYKECNGQPWKQVTVEFGALSILTTVTVDAVMDTLIPPLALVNFYAPWDIDTTCTQARIKSKKQ